MNHKEKVKMARKMLSNKEKEDRTPMFLSKAWLARQDAIAFRISQKRKTKI
jgi:hypothetical protein